MQHQKSLFIFRRDLRLEDNTALIEALQNSQEVIPVFIFDPRQRDKKNNPYFSQNAFQFLIESLTELDKDLQKKGSHLYLFEGKAHEVVEQIMSSEHIDAVYANKDYTPFSIARDESIEKTCAKRKVTFKSFHDALLHAPEDTLKADKKPYTIFTPFYNNALRLPVKTPQKNTFKNYYSKNIRDETKMPIVTENKEIFIRGGRSSALRILSHINTFQEYTSKRDIPSIHGTTGLSAHHKFGTISVRESFYTMNTQLGIEHALVRQLFWRDFFTMIAYYTPEVFGHAFQKKYDAVSWIIDEHHKPFIAWKEGKTGFPLVDAGMRELNTTGYMHNRVRMVVASFLTKDLHIDWRLGEKYFATKLVDYDPCVNNGSWQWAASTGCDAQPYFRIFNPWLQQERFDPECIYIKKWIPELQELDAKQIHQLYKQRPLIPINYPKPIVEHKEESAKAIARFKNA